MSIVYVLVNEAMPGYVKVGITDNIEQRMRSLDTTATPLPFECFYAATVQDASFVEQQIFEAFADSRVRKNREFFRIAPERIAAVVKLRELEDVTPRSDVVENEDDQRALDEARVVEERPSPAERRASLTWAKRLKRVFNIDTKTCSECTGAVKVIACIEDPKVIRQILDHLKHKGEYQDAIQLPDSRASPQVDLLH